MKKTKKTLTIEQALKAANSSKNQEIKRMFVGQHVYCNVGTLVETILKASDFVREPAFTFDDIENYYSVNTELVIDTIMQDWDENKEEWIEYANCPDSYNRKVKTESDFRVFLHSLDEDELKIFANDGGYDWETEPQEIYEWWAVSQYLFGKLKDLGYCVVDAGSCYIWGRSITGQAILLDHCISKICAEMEILEGQSNSWAK